MASVKLPCADPTTGRIFADVDGTTGGGGSVAEVNSIYVLMPAGGTYPTRPAFLGHVLFFPGGAQPPNTGSTSGGGGMVDGWDLWLG